MDDNDLTATLFLSVKLKKSGAAVNLISAATDDAEKVFQEAIEQVLSLVQFVLLVYCFSFCRVNSHFQCLKVPNVNSIHNIFLRKLNVT